MAGIRQSALKGKRVSDLPALTSQWEPTKRRFGQSSYASAIDNCLWDILGKAVGMPVYRILGAYRGRVRLMRARSTHHNVEDFVNEFGKCKGEGFQAYKIHPDRVESGGDYRVDIEVAKAVRQTAGADYALLMDPVGGYTRDEALR